MAHTILGETPIYRHHSRHPHHVLTSTSTTTSTSTSTSKYRYQLIAPQGMILTSHHMHMFMTWYSTRDVARVIPCIPTWWTNRVWVEKKEVVRVMMYDVTFDSVVVVHRADAC